MKSNVGRADKIIRVIIGVALIIAGITYGSWLGIIGLVIVGTAIKGWCPLYGLFGLTTNSEK